MWDGWVRPAVHLYVTHDFYFFFTRLYCFSISLPVRQWNIIMSHRQKNKVIVLKWNGSAPSGLRQQTESCTDSRGKEAGCAEIKARCPETMTRWCFQRGENGLSMWRSSLLVHIWLWPTEPQCYWDEETIKTEETEQLLFTVEASGESTPAVRESKS